MSPRYYPFIFLRYICKKETSWSNSFEIIYFSRSFSGKFYQRNHEWSNLFSYNRVSNLCKTWSRSEIWSLGGKLHKIPSREGTTYHVPLERKKKERGERGAFEKRKKFARPDGGHPRLAPLNFRSSTERQRVDRVCFSSLRGWLEDGRGEWNTLQGEKLGNSPLFRAIHANFFARCIVQTQLVRLLGSEGNMKPETTGGSVHQERDHRGENLSSSTRKLRLVGFFFFLF